MAKTVTTTISATVSGDGYGGSGPFFLQSAVNAAGLAPGSFVLAVGANTIPIPIAALGVTIVSATGSTSIKTFKGVAGDTGVPIAAGGTLSVDWTAAQIAQFVLNASAIETVQLIWK